MLQVRFQQRKCGTKPPAERHSQRRIEAFRLSFGELFTVVGQYSEIRVGIERDGK